MHKGLFPVSKDIIQTLELIYQLLLVNRVTRYFSIIEMHSWNDENKKNIGSSNLIYHSIFLFYITGFVKARIIDFFRVHLSQKYLQRVWLLIL